MTVRELVTEAYLKAGIPEYDHKAALSYLNKLIEYWSS